MAAVLYETIAGRPAFPGATPMQRISAILSRDPEPLPFGACPPGLEQVLRRALARERSHRHASSSALLSDLRRVSKGQAVADLPITLAILDFENLSRSPDDEWIGSGIAESLGAALERASGVHVVPREELLRARAALAATAEASGLVAVGLALGARWLQTGSFQRMGGALRITSRLFEVATGEVVATEQLDGTTDQIFEMQDRLAAATREVLNLKAPHVPLPTTGIAAFECYARGRRFWNRLEKGSFEEAAEHYREAIRLDSSYPPAHAGLAALHAMRFTFTTDPRELETAADHARRAVDMDPADSESYVWLGYARMRQERLAEALELETQATRLEPSNMMGWYFAGVALLAAGRPDEAVPHLQSALAIAPHAPYPVLVLGIAHLTLERFVDARWCLEKARELERKHPDIPTVGASGVLADCLRRSGDLDEARKLAMEGLKTVEDSDHMLRDTQRGVCLCVLGRVALDQTDQAAARAACSQAVLHVRGRPRALGAGHVMVQALAGLARAGEGASIFEEARSLFEARAGLNFSWGGLCSDDVTLLELSKAAMVVGRYEEAGVLLRRAAAAGFRDASRESRP